MKWIVDEYQNLAACDTFDENDPGPTQRQLYHFEFKTEKEAFDFYNTRKSQFKFAGVAGQYVTYPTKQEK